MPTFTKLELAALHSIFSERPELELQLEQQLSIASVVGRENTGAGFFTTILVPPDNAALVTSEPFDGETHALVPGLEHGLGFVLFFEHGRLRTLEGFTYGESTASLDLTSLTFEIAKIPVNRI